MTPGREEDDSEESIRVDLPFGSFRVGRGARGWRMEVNDRDAYDRARRRVRAKLGFNRHLATYAAVMAAVVFIDLITGGGLSNLVLWFAGFWGAFLVFMAFNIFILPHVWSREAEERMTQEELRRGQDD